MKEIVPWNVTDKIDSGFGGSSSGNASHRRVKLTPPAGGARRPPALDHRPAKGVCATHMELHEQFR